MDGTEDDDTMGDGEAAEKDEEGTGEHQEGSDDDEENEN